MSRAACNGDVSNLVGRDAARSALAMFLCRALTGPTQGFVIAGDAGIGKTALWCETIEQCRAAGVEVLWIRAFEEEMSGVLVAINDLLRQAGAEPATLDSETDVFELGDATLSAFRQMLDRGPVLIAIDDVQWLDDASARILRHVLRRLDAEPLSLLVTHRAGSGACDSLELQKTLPPGRTGCHELGGLSCEELRQVVAGVVPSISPIAMRRIHEVSAGNPLYAIELARSIVEPAADALPAERLRLPVSLQEAIEQRIEGLPHDVNSVLEVVAASGPMRLATVKMVLPNLAVDKLVVEACDLAVLAMDDDLRLRFSHPLIGAAVYGRMDPLRRRAVHGRLASAISDLDVRMRHIALSADGPDAAVASALEGLAERARSRGASDVAADFARHSGRLTPTADDADRRRRTILEATSLAAAGETERACDLMDVLIAATPPGPERARALVQRFYVENDDVDRADAALVAALGDVADVPALQASVLDILAWHRGVFRGDLRAGIECASEALSIAERVGAEDVRMMASAHLAHMRIMAGEPQPVMMEQAIAMSDAIGGPALGGGPKAWLAKQLTWSGELEMARAMVLEVQDGHRAAGNEQERSYRRYDLALIELAGGKLDAAEQTARGAIEAAQDSSNLDAEGWAYYPLALSLAWKGQRGEARNAVDQLVEWPGRPGQRIGRARGYSVLGLLALSLGDPAEALEHLLQALELMDLAGIEHSGVLPVLPDAIEAHIILGHQTEGERLLTRLRHQADRLGCRSVSAQRLQAEGVVLMGAGEFDEAATRFSDAHGVFQSCGLRTDAARALLWLGRAVARNGQRSEAMQVLSDAKAAFADMGAALWEAQADLELERVAPGSSVGTLTQIESQVTELVASGAKNREVAAALFVSVATVEAHLTRIYRKLGIRSRTELAGLVFEGAIEIDM